MSLLRRRMLLSGGDKNPFAEPPEIIKSTFTASAPQPFRTPVYLDDGYYYAPVYFSSGMQWGYCSTLNGTWTKVPNMSTHTYWAYNLVDGVKNMTFDGYGSSTSAAIYSQGASNGTRTSYLNWTLSTTTANAVFYGNSVIYDNDKYIFLVYVRASSSINYATYVVFCDSTGAFLYSRRIPASGNYRLSYAVGNRVLVVGDYYYVLLYIQTTSSISSAAPALFKIPRSNPQTGTWTEVAATPSGQNILQQQYASWNYNKKSNNFSLIRYLTGTAANSNLVLTSSDGAAWNPIDVRAQVQARTLNATVTGYWEKSIVGIFFSNAASSSPATLFVLSSSDNTEWISTATTGDDLQGLTASYVLPACVMREDKKSYYIRLGASSASQSGTQYYLRWYK